ncbi:MAG: Lrp/AsnC ligand binding domain-containing protein [candidate division WOR-3 bacterium]
MNKYTAFVLMKVNVGKLPEVSKELLAIEEIKELYMITGEFDLLAILETEKYEQLGEVIVEKIQKVKNVEKTQTLMSFKTYRYFLG